MWKLVSLFLTSVYLFTFILWWYLFLFDHILQVDIHSPFLYWFNRDAWEMSFHKTFVLYNAVK